MTNYIDRDEFAAIMDDSILMIAESMNAAYKEAFGVFKARYVTFSRRDKWEHAPISEGFLGWGDERTQFFSVFLTQSVKVFTSLFKNRFDDAITLKKYTEALLRDNPFLNTFLEAPVKYADNLTLLNGAVHEYNTNTFVSMSKEEREKIKTADADKIYVTVQMLKKKSANATRKLLFPKTPWRRLRVTLFQIFEKLLSALFWSAGAVSPTLLRKTTTKTITRY